MENDYQTYTKSISKHLCGWFFFGFGSQFGPWGGLVKSFFIHLPTLAKLERRCRPSLLPEAPEPRGASISSVVNRFPTDC